MAEDESNTGIADNNAELVDKDIPAISVILAKEAALDSTISVDVGKDVEDSTNALRDKLDENVAKKAAVDLLRE